MTPIDPKHLTLEELQHYGSIGYVKGLDPAIADDLERLAELNSNRAYEGGKEEGFSEGYEQGLSESDEAEYKDAYQDSMRFLEEVFSDEANKKSYAESFRGFRYLVKNGPARDE